jgi:hypothetical protein
MTEKRFDDEEVALILRRAIEPDGGRPDGTGLTLSQLKEIAVEVGIDPARMEAAALAVQAEGRVGGTKHGRVTARYDVLVGGALPQERRAQVVRVIRDVMGRQGVVSSELGALTWKARDEFGGRYVTVTSEEGGTRIEALGNFRDGAMVTGAVGGSLGLAATAIALKVTGALAALGLATPLLLGAGATLPAWLIYRRRFRKEDAALRQAVAQIAAEVDAGGPAALAEGAAGPDAGDDTTRE